ncbi:MAG: hypothetical protein WHS87_10070 [Anaerolineales bacterium]
MSPKSKSRPSIQAGDRSVVIGGDASNNIIITGDGNVAHLSSPFEPIYRRLAEDPRLDATEKADARAELQEIEAEARKPTADESFLERRLRNLRRIAPDILDVVLATLASPAAGFSLVARKVAERMRAEAAKSGGSS